MFLQNPFNGAFGLDVGDLSIKLIQLKTHWNLKNKTYYTVEEMRSISLPPGYIVDGEIQQPEMVRKKLLRLLGKTENRKAITCPWVVADLPEPKSFLKIIEIDVPEEELTDDDIIAQAKKHLPLDIEKTYLDWQVVENGGNKNSTKVVIGASTKSTADIYTYLLESVGLRLLALEFEGVSIARAMITSSKDYEGEARAILDLGATRSSLIIYDNEAIQFSMEINFSGEILTTAIAQGLKIDHAKAEKLKIKNGLIHDKNFPKYIKVVSQFTDDLIEKIEEVIKFYKDHFKETNDITHITMCGGLSNLKNLDKVLSEKLKIETAPGHAWKNLLHPDENYFSETNGLPYASAIGLALRAVGNIDEQKI